MIAAYSLLQGVPPATGFAWTGADYQIPFYVVLVLALMGFLLFLRELRETHRQARLHKAEALLRQSSGLLMAMLRANPMAVLQVNSFGSIEFWNDAADRLFGWRAAETIGKPVPFVTREGRAAFRTLRARVMAGESFIEQEMPCCRRDGTLIEVLFSCAPVRAVDGSILGMIAMFLDVTESKRIVSAHQEVQDQLRQSQKLETIGRLAGGVAHDFNNLLQVIQGNTEIALRCLPENALVLKDAVLEIAKAGDKASQLTQQLLAFSRRQVFQPVTLSLNDVIADMEKMIGRILGEDVFVHTEYAPDLRPILADSGQLGQVIMNLAVNARDAMPEGGSFTLLTRKFRLTPGTKPPLPDMQPGDYSMLSIEDTGCGMDDNVKSHLFEPFFTTKEKGKGTGLGLATVYGIVNQIGGFIHIDSEPSIGTTCSLYFPAFGEETEAEAPDDPPGGHPRGTETILVAEDEEGVLRLIAKTLDECGYTVLAGSTGSDVLRVSASHSGPIDLLITDILMPEFSGRELASRMQAERPGLKVLYMSGFSEALNATASEANDDVLEKPFQLRTLTQRIRQALDAPAGTASASDSLRNTSTVE